MAEARCERIDVHAPDDLGVLVPRLDFTLALTVAFAIILACATFIIIGIATALVINFVGALCWLGVPVVGCLDIIALLNFTLSTFIFLYVLL